MNNAISDGEGDDEWAVGPDLDVPPGRRGPGPPPAPCRLLRCITLEPPIRAHPAGEGVREEGERGEYHLVPSDLS